MKLFLLSLMLSVAPLSAARIFQISVNTQTISGVNGYLDFQFNPGGGDSDPGTAAISLYSGGTLDMAMVAGDVTGSLPGVVTIGNTTGFNNLFQAITFGAQVFFWVTIDGPVLNSPDPLSTSGSSFSFSMFADDQVTPLLTDDAFGYAVTIDAGPQGAIAVSNLARLGVVEISDVPEPGSVWLALVGMAAIVGGVLRRKIAG
ncbi:MAG: NF038129 family PEP-CTERM protein [Bryobacterales bacterium]|nr:NF038129 family PEP-CTERM protein [Bryobacterales bacterium]